LALREAEGYTTSPVRPPLGTAIDLVRAQEQALQAFDAGRCLVFVGDEQVECLDQEIEVAADMRVRFIRLLQLRGG
jgi:hypothetical protein